MTMRKDVVCLKVGGSVITKKEVEDFPLKIDEIRKRALEFIKLQVVKRVADEIKSTLNKINLPILVLGVGPFGHYLVKKGLENRKIHASVFIFAKVMERALKKFGIECRYIERFSPFHSVRFEGEKPVFERLKEMKDFKGTLLLTGDVTRDGKIVSGDILLSKLSIEFQANRAVAATDVDGLFTKDPKKHEDAKLLRRIKPNQPIMISKLKDEYDVTGRLPAKIIRLQEAAKHGIKCYVVNALVKNRLRKALLGRKVYGTIIY